MSVLEAAMSLERASEVLVPDEYFKFKASRKSIEDGQQLKGSLTRAVFGGGYIVTGRIGAITAVRTVIGRDLWDACDDFRFEASMLESFAQPITIYLVEIVPSHDASPADLSVNRGGRPATHSWDAMFDELFLLVGREGFPDDRRTLYELMNRAFGKLGAIAPDEDQLRRWLREKHPRIWAELSGQN